MIVPTATEHWARLSRDLRGERHPYICQSCGIGAPIVLREDEPEDNGFTRWQEHDQHDRPEPIYVVLCKACAERLIEKHERLYRQLSKFEPALGCMQACAECKFRQGLHCSNPRAKENGGEGVGLKMPKPSGAFVDGVDSRGRRTGGFMHIFVGPIRECDGFEMFDNLDA